MDAHRAGGNDVIAWIIDAVEHQKGTWATAGRLDQSIALHPDGVSIPCLSTELMVCFHMMLSDGVNRLLI